jgi:hypothetical protein
MEHGAHASGQDSLNDPVLVDGERTMLQVV